MDPYQNTTSRSSLKASAPIEIPSRQKARSTSPKLSPSSCRSTSSASELLFEMSPFDDDVSASFHKKNTIYPSPLCRDSKLEIDHAGVKDVYFVQGPLRKRFKPYSPASKSPHSPLAKFPHYVPPPEKRRTTVNPAAPYENVAIATPPPVIRTTAVHKICGFIPAHSTPGKPPQEPQPKLPLTPSSLPPRLLPGVRNDEPDSYGSPLDFEKFIRVYRLERRRIRPHRSTARVS